MSAAYTAGQFPKFEDDVYRMAPEDSFHFLLPTAETALINLYRGEILEDEADLPKRHVCLHPLLSQRGGHLPCVSERGMIRGHQFNKVEMFGYTRPEDSDAMLKELIGKACALVERSGPALPPVQAGGRRLLRVHGHDLRYRAVDSQHERIQGVLLRFQRA